jgi:hypothetical protein
MALRDEVTFACGKVNSDFRQGGILPVHPRVGAQKDGLLMDVRVQWRVHYTPQDEEAGFA